MMKSICYLSILFVIVSCSNRKEYLAEDYQKIQVEYESSKIEFTKNQIEANRSKEQLFTENKGMLISLVQLVDQLKDTATVFDDVNSDTTFFKNDVLMQPVNFGVTFPNRFSRSSKSNEKSNLPTAKAIFLNRGDFDDSNQIFSNYLKDLRACLMTNNDAECLEISREKLQDILDLKYAFLVREFIRMDPKLKDDMFEGGLYAAGIVCYDIESRNPIFSFVVTAGSSEEISYNERFNQSPAKMIQQDFKMNIKKGILETCQQHFQFADGIRFIGNI